MNNVVHQAFAATIHEEITAPNHWYWADHDGSVCRVLRHCHYNIHFTLTAVADGVLISFTMDDSHAQVQDIVYPWDDPSLILYIHMRLARLAPVWEVTAAYDESLYQ